MSRTVQQKVGRSSPSERASPAATSDLGVAVTVARPAANGHVLTGVYQNMKCAIVAHVFRCKVTAGSLTTTGETTDYRWASCGADALARDTDGIYPDEVLRFPLYPRPKADVADRRTLGLGIHLMRRTSY